MTAIIDNWATDWAEQLLRRHLAALSGNSSIQLELGGTSTRYGQKNGAAGGAGSTGEEWRTPLQARMRISRREDCRRLVTGGEIGAAEAYMDGAWTADDLPALIRIFIRNLAVTRRRGPIPWLRSAFDRLTHLFRANTRRGASRNIQAHYDLSNQFFELFLDETLSYSAAIFPLPWSTLREGSEFKFQRLAAKLDLRSQDHLLEIGTGWGGFAIHAASRHGCQVTTTTISPSQLEEARRRVAEAGQQNRVHCRLLDYRDLTGSYDKLVSVEMIEAVGHRFIPGFFRKCGQLLKPSGQLVIQAIVMDDRRHLQYVRGIDFIRKHIFPGGCLPSLASMRAAVANETDFRWLHWEDITPHYAETLRGWRERFMARRDEARQLGFDERFLRMWEFYLCYCEAAFEERCIQSVQFVLGRPGCLWDPISAPWEFRDARRATSPSPGDSP